MFFNRRGTLVSEVEYIETEPLEVIEPIEIASKFILTCIIVLMSFIALTV